MLSHLCSKMFVFSACPNFGLKKIHGKIEGVCHEYGDRRRLEIQDQKRRFLWVMDLVVSNSQLAPRRCECGFSLSVSETPTTLRHRKHLTHQGSTQNELGSWNLDWTLGTYVGSLGLWETSCNGGECVALALSCYVNS